MTTSRVVVGRAVATALLLGAITACGLKGPLELPERSTNIVIRGPGETPAAGTGDATGESSAAPPPAPGSPGPTTTTKPKDERLPPPQLPDGNPGSSRGG